MKKSSSVKARENTAFLYPRLSRDDNLEGESYSIQNQQKLLTKTAKEMGYTNLVTFVDDGVSGVTMDRPGFNAMMEELEQGHAAAVFVKDMSRLGRNYIEVGRLMEEFFPSHDIRLVAISDGIDTAEGDNELAPIKNLFNEKHSQKVPLNPYNWDQATVVGILENRQYTGCAVNFKSTTVSYKVHKVIHNPVDQQQIIPNMQEPIVSEEIWLRVQELRENRRRNTATGRTSLFSGLVFCPDCGAKLHFCAAKSLKPNQEFFRCANYKDGRGTCKIHYIRNVALEKIVLEAISDMADFVRCHESIFMYMIAKKNKAMQKAEFEQLKKTVSNSKVRLGELDKLMAKLYEDNVLGRVTDDFFQMMMKNYEREQKELTMAVANGEQVLQSSEQKSADTRLLIRTFREMTDIKDLTPIIVNKLIERIEVHNNDKTSGHCYVKVDVYFTGVGMISIPSEEELLAMMEDIRKNPEEYRLAA